MKKRILSVVLVLILLLFVAINAKADTKKDPHEEAVKIRCTCYYYNSGCTASGKPAKGEYNTIAGKPEWMGEVAALYDVAEDGSKGDFIGYFEVTDTGGEAIRNGNLIDVYRVTLSMCKMWVKVHGDYVYMELYEGEG